MPKISAAGGSSKAGLSQEREKSVLLRGAHITIHDGALEFSDGTGTAPDVAIKRQGAATIVVSGTLKITGNFELQGSSQALGNFIVFNYFGAGGNVQLGSAPSLVGFYGADPVIRPTVAGARNSPEGALANLLTALATLGLINNTTTVS